MVSSFFLVDLIFPVYSKYFLFLITAMTLATVTDSYRWNSIFLLGVIFISISLRAFLKHSSDSRNLKNNIRCCPLWSTTDRSFPFWFSFFILDLARKLEHTIYPVARISHNRYRGVLPMRTSLSFLVFVLLAHGTVPAFKDEAAPVQAFFELIGFMLLSFIAVEIVVVSSESCHLETHAWLLEMFCSRKTTISTSFIILKIIALMSNIGFCL